MCNVSIVMVTYNGSVWIPSQLEAIMSQMSPECELIVFDDHSTDDSAGLLPHHWTDTNFRLLRGDRRRGKAACLNDALRAARHEVLLIVDQDDVISPGYVKALAEGTLKHGFAFGRMEYSTLNDPDHVAALWDHPDQDRASVKFRDPEGQVHHVRVGSGCCLGIRRDVASRLGGFSTDVGCTDDIDLCLRAASLGYTYVQVAEAVVSYRYRVGYRELFCQRMWYGGSWCLLEEKYHAKGIVPRRTIRVAFEIVMALRKLLSSSRARRLQGSAELGFSYGQMLGRTRRLVRGPLPWVS